MPGAVVTRAVMSTWAECCLCASELNLVSPFKQTHSTETAEERSSLLLSRVLIQPHLGLASLLSGPGQVSNALDFLADFVGKQFRVIRQKNLLAQRDCLCTLAIHVEAAACV